MCGRRYIPVLFYQWRQKVQAQEISPQMPASGLGHLTNFGHSDAMIMTIQSLRAYV